MTQSFDPVVAAVAEITAAFAAAGVTTPVRGDEPDPGDQLGAGEYVAFVQVELLDGPPLRGRPVRDVTLVVKAYDVTRLAARALGARVEAVFANKGARSAASGLGVWHSKVVSASPDIDPGTKQPLWTVIVSYPTTTIAVRTP
jgi:hypothetical protein